MNKQGVEFLCLVVPTAAGAKAAIHVRILKHRKVRNKSLVINPVMG